MVAKTECICGKKFVQSQGLSRHKKKCLVHENAMLKKELKKIKTIERDIDELKKRPSGTVNNNIDINIYNDIKIYACEKVDLVKVLTEMYGVDGALNKLISFVYGQDDNKFLEMFLTIYKDGNNGVLPIKCEDKKNSNFEYLEPNKEWKKDYGGQKIHSSYLDSLIDAHLMMINDQVISKVSTDKFGDLEGISDKYGERLDVIDVSKFLDNAISVKKRMPVRKFSRLIHNPVYSETVKS